MSAPAVKRMTLPEFFTWAEAQDKGRYELIRGEIVAMSPERAEHAHAKRRIANALEAAIKRAGLACEAYVDGLAVVVDDETSYEPDALVNCGAPIPPQSVTAPTPVVVVEVLSPSSRNLDKSVKLADYFRVPGLAHYLIVDLGRQHVLHYRRQGDGVITVTIVKDSAIGLDPPGLSIQVADCFA